MNDDVTTTEVIEQLANQVRNVANAISPLDASMGHDETGGTVASLTEAVMGVTAGLCKIAEAIGWVAEQFEEYNAKTSRRKSR